MYREFFSSEPSRSDSHQESDSFCETENSHYDRALTRNELCELLDVNDQELELLLVNEMLKPSLHLEYGGGRFLGFFTYRDCLHTVISRACHAHLRDMEAALELSEEIHLAVADELVSVAQHIFPNGICDLSEEKRIGACIRAALREHLLLGTIPVTSATMLPITDELLSGIAGLNKRFLRLSTEHPQTVSPFAVQTSLLFS